VALDDPDKIDFLSVASDGSEIILTLTATPLVGDELGHLHMLQAKIKRYLDFARSGEVHQVLNGRVPRSTPVRIDVVAPRPLVGQNGERFLEHWEDVANEEGVALTFRVLPT
jgi:hypothetical protein